MGRKRKSSLSDKPIPFSLGRGKPVPFESEAVDKFYQGAAVLRLPGERLGMLGSDPCPPGTKYDTQKPRHSLIPVEVTDALLAVLEFGAKKYAPDNWKHVQHGETRYTDALERHLDAIKRGERLDPDSGLPHIAQVLANAAFLVWFDTQAAKAAK